MNIYIYIFSVKLIYNEIYNRKISGPYYRLYVYKYTPWIYSCIL